MVEILRSENTVMELSQYEIRDTNEKFKLEVAALKDDIVLIKSEIEIERAQTKDTNKVEMEKLHEVITKQEKK